ncbi:hypothetical protein [Methylobacterium planeticum]|uniref:Uncharacterized protein n=1 Tax=Methylobacterium planeticum TaxID=2615211 RepID=A0A6N6MNC7_9HYPH|nr:hypothetical protein [Methylobacterium planeticum]KAB1071659.1 hypothetical protein F6X51_19060 [Methylobacterium planeticum]
MINDLIEPLGASCEDWDGEILAVFDRHGRSRLAPTLSDLWSAVEALTGERIDPLLGQGVGGAVQ